MKAFYVILRFVVAETALSGVDSAVFNLSFQWEYKFFRFGEYLQTSVHL